VLTWTPIHLFLTRFVSLSTRVWMHRTIIPPQETPSVSYARDFFADSCSAVSKSTRGEGMINLDGVYATRNIPSDTIIVTEKDMPDCELHRSSNPNCEVIELEDGTSALVSIQDIGAGDFFCVAESSDESDDEYDE
jgi:hypothetical protein